MPKRPREDDGGPAKKKKATNLETVPVPLKALNVVQRPVTAAPPAEIDFPRGGGSSFTPLESKAIRAEAIQELKDEEVFQDAAKSKQKKSLRKQASSKTLATGDNDKDRTRIQVLNYKNLAPGQKVLAQIIAIHPLALVVSLPHQLLGHIPITHISSLFTERLEKSQDADDASQPSQGEDEKEDGDIPDLEDMFFVGQYLAAVIEEVRSPGAKGSLDFSRTRDEMTRAAKRVELSIDPLKVNKGVAKADLVSGFTVSSVVKSVEDHGYILDIGVPGLSGFLSLKEARRLPRPSPSSSDPSSSTAPASPALYVGQIIATTVLSTSSNGRTITLSPTPLLGSHTSPNPPTELSSINSLIPGTIVPSQSALITHVLPWGLNLQLFGFFKGTVDLFHLPLHGADSAEEKWKVGDRVRARVLFDVPPGGSAELGGDGGEGRTFGLSLLEHVVTADPDGPKIGAPVTGSESKKNKRTKGKDVSQTPAAAKDERRSVKDAYPIGMVLESVVIRRVESEWGLVVETSDGAAGFVHISHVSDSHLPSLSATSGPYRVGTTHRARILSTPLSHSAIDGLLSLSLKESVLDQPFLRPADLEVGSRVKGTIKSLDLERGALWVVLAGGGDKENVGGIEVDGVVWRDQWADIRLKHPERRFKTGASIKCRVLTVSPALNRVTLTLKKSLVESDLPLVTRVEDAVVDLITPAVVSKVLPKGALIEFFGGVKGWIPIKEISDEKLQTPESALVPSQVTTVRILSVDTTVTPPRIAASIKRALSSYTPSVPITSLALGSPVSSARLVEVQKDNFALDLLPSGIRALVSIRNLATRRGTDAGAVKEEMQSKVGQEIAIELVVVSRNGEKGFVICAAADPKRSEKKESKEKKKAANEDELPAIDVSTLAPGSIVQGRVVSHTLKPPFAPGVGCIVRIGHSISGSLHPLDWTDDFKRDLSTLTADDAPAESAKDASKTVYPPPIGSIHSFSVLSVDKHHRRLVLSSRPSKLTPGKSKVIDREINSVSDLKQGETVRGIVKSVADAGLFVSLGRSVHGRVLIREMFDDYVKDWKPRFSVNQLLEARVLKVDAERSQVELSLRTRQIQVPDASAALTYKDLVEGTNVDGVVKKVELYGLFVEIKGSKISGLCHKSEISDNKKSDVSRALKLFKEGDPVRARILTVDVEKRRVNFGLKPSYFADDADAVPVADSEDEDNATAIQDDEGEESAEVGDDEEVGSDGGDDVDEDVEMLSAEDLGEPEEDASASDSDEDEAESDGDVAMKDVPSVTRDEPLPPTMLQLRRGFEWNSKGSATVGDEADSNASESDSDSDDEGAAKSRKKKKKHQVQQDLTAIMHTKAPESTADFERLLLGSPNSSFLWIQYMSFQLQLSEIDKAREIGKRAIGAINFREEQERLNVWIARLNLENTYGTEETLESTFKEACKYHEAKHMHLRLATILEQTEKFDQAEEIYRRATKKFGQSSKVWSLFGEHYLKRDRAEDARKLLPRSLQSLEKRKHLKTISKFAQLEYKLGDAERGKTIFEGIIDSHAKRLDLWSIYIDMEAGQKDIQSIRGIFSRLFQQKLSSKKAKFFFKKWLGLEKSIGDEAGIDMVKARAIEWTQGGTETVQA